MSSFPSIFCSVFYTVVVHAIFATYVFLRRAVVVLFPFTCCCKLIVPACDERSRRRKAREVWRGGLKTKPSVVRYCRKNTTPEKTTRKWACLTFFPSASNFRRLNSVPSSHALKPVLFRVYLFFFLWPCRCLGRTRFFSAWKWCSLRASGQTVQDGRGCGRRRGARP